ncbi:MAG: SRPBCC family protein [Candidatus Eisenbacteria bacterium]
MKLLILLAVLVAAAWFVPAPVSHVESAIEISAPRERVWTILADVTSARLWDRQMREVTITSTAKSGVGTERASNGPVVKTRERVTEWVPYNRLELVVEHDPKLTKFETSRIEMTPSGATGTHVRWSLDYQMNGGYLGNLADRFLLGGTHQGRIDDGLARLKRYAETGDVMP